MHKIIYLTVSALFCGSALVAANGLPAAKAPMPLAKKQQVHAVKQLPCPPKNKSKFCQCVRLAELDLASAPKTVPVVSTIKPRTVCAVVPAAENASNGFFIPGLVAFLGGAVWLLSTDDRKDISAE